MDATTETGLITLGVKTASDLFGPLIKSIAQTINDVYFMKIGEKIRFNAEKQKIEYEQGLADFKKRVQHKAEIIPEELFCTPDIQTLAAIFDAAKFCLTKEQLREMFANLIAATINKQNCDKVHPFYAETISHMSALDAQNLALFRSGLMPVVEYFISVSPGNTSTLFSNVFLENPDEQDIEKQSISITVLEQQGLLHVSYDAEVKDIIPASARDRAITFCTSPKYDKYDPNRQPALGYQSSIANVKHGVAELTSYGKSFLNICMPVDVSV